MQSSLYRSSYAFERTFLCVFLITLLDLYAEEEDKAQLPYCYQSAHVGSSNLIRQGVTRDRRICYSEQQNKGEESDEGMEIEEGGSEEQNAVMRVYRGTKLICSQSICCLSVVCRKIMIIDCGNFSI